MSCGLSRGGTYGQFGGAPDQQLRRGRAEDHDPRADFSLIVTAEPYLPCGSRARWCLENEVGRTQGRISHQHYKLMRRGQYQKMGNPLALSLDWRRCRWKCTRPGTGGHRQVARGEKYAPEIFAKADVAETRENALARKANSGRSSPRRARRCSPRRRARACRATPDEERVAASARPPPPKPRQAEAKAATEAAAAKQKADAEAVAAKQRADEEAKRQASWLAPGGPDEGGGGGRRGQSEAEADA